jgi:hypothetical protein
VRRRCGAGSALGRAGPRRAKAAARQSGGAACAGLGWAGRGAGRSILAQQPGPPARRPLDGVRRRCGANSALGRAGPRRAKAAARRRGGAACAGLGRAGRGAGRIILAQQPGPPAGRALDGVRRRCGANSALGRASGKGGGAAARRRGGGAAAAARAGPGLAGRSIQAQRWPAGRPA